MTPTMELPYISQLVSDQKKALEFYTRILGFEKHVDAATPNGPRFLKIAPKGQAFQLVLWPGKPGEPQMVYGRLPATVTLETPEIQVAYAELKSRGVTFETEVLEYPWGWVAVFFDQDGNHYPIT